MNEELRAPKPGQIDVDSGLNVEIETVLSANPKSWMTFSMTLP